MGSVVLAAEGDGDRWGKIKECLLPHLLGLVKRLELEFELELPELELQEKQ